YGNRRHGLAGTLNRNAGRFQSALDQGGFDGVGRRAEQAPAGRSVHDTFILSRRGGSLCTRRAAARGFRAGVRRTVRHKGGRRLPDVLERSEEHTSELQSRENLVCRLLLE